MLTYPVHISGVTSSPDLFWPIHQREEIHVHKNERAQWHQNLGCPDQSMIFWITHFITWALVLRNAYHLTNKSLSSLQIMTEGCPAKLFNKRPGSYFFEIWPHRIYTTKFKLLHNKEMIICFWVVQNGPPERLQLALPKLVQAVRNFKHFETMTV